MTTPCNICQQPIETITHYYQNHPYQDGHNYEDICHTCAAAPPHNNPKTLQEQGFTPQQIKHTLQAIKQKLKHPKIKPNQTHNTLLITENLPKPQKIEKSYTKT